MATTRALTATDIGERIADETSHLSFIRGIWSRELPDRIEAWIVTDAVESEDELLLYGLPLHDWFTNRRVRVIVVNPQDYEPNTDLARDIVPASADPIRRSSTP